MPLLSRKVRKLFRDPNRFFFDFFAKRVGAPSYYLDSQLSRIADDRTFELEDDLHPWVQLANAFGLRTGAMSGHRDQSMLVNSTLLLEVLEYLFRLAHARGDALRFYTLKGAFELDVPASATWNMQLLEKAYVGISSKPDFAVELIGHGDSVFALHLLIYDVSERDVVLLRSNDAHVKRVWAKMLPEIYPAPESEMGRYQFDTNGPIDVVYTWVNKDDPNWQQMWNDTFPDRLCNPDRFACKNELLYSLRSLAKYAPWVRNIYVVTNCAKPSWLGEQSNLRWVSHEEIFPDPDVLPVFNSHAIEACLHRIPGLSQRFIYLNDDFLLAEPCYPHDFFDEAGRSVSYLEPYGMVAPDNLFKQSTEYLAPAIKSQRLIRRKFPDWPATRLHKHCPYALRKDTLERAEKFLGEEIETTRAAKMRTPEDINLPSFFYHHFAQARGDAVERPVNYQIVRPRNIEQFEKTKFFRRFKFVCFNDGDGSAEDQDYVAKFEAIMEKIFPEPSPFEASN